MSISASSQTELHADCSNCFALCCVTTAFVESDDFAFGRMAGVACPNITSDYKCGIHENLRASGMRGCTTFDCFGAGQKVSNVTFKGRSWNESSVVKTQMILVFSVVRKLHELLWYLSDAASFGEQSLTQEITSEYARIEALSQLDVKALFAVSADAQQSSNFSSVDTRQRTSPRKMRIQSQLCGQGLVKQTFAGVDLRGGDLTATKLVDSDMSNINLASCDVLNATFKRTNVRGADLSSAIYLTQMQLNNCDGDLATVIGPRFYRPSHWSN